MSQTKTGSRPEGRAQEDSQEIDVSSVVSVQEAEASREKTLEELHAAMQRFLKFDSFSRHYIRSMHGLKIMLKKRAVHQGELDSMSFFQKVWNFGRTLELWGLVNNVNYGSVVFPVFSNDLSFPHGYWSGIVGEMKEAEDMLDILSELWPTEFLQQFVDLVDEYLDKLIEAEEADEKERLEGIKGIEEVAARVVEETEVADIKKRWKERLAGVR